MPSLDFLASLKVLRLRPVTIVRVLAFIILIAFFYETWSFNKITCIHVPQLDPPPRTIGELYQRTQLAFFLSSHLSAKLSIGSLTAFDKCPRAEKSCILHEDELMLPRCDPADCVCHARKIAPYLKKVSQCSTLQLIVENVRTSEFSGCTHQAVTKYLPPERGSYSVLAYAASGAKRMSEHEARYIQKQLCKLSDKPIVVIADKSRKVPMCENRTILATGLNDESVVRLISGAEIVGAKEGENVHMGVSGMNGGRLITTADAIGEFDWAPVEGFTVVGARGSVFHFDDVEVMRQAIGGGDAELRLSHLTFRMEGDERADPEVFVWNVPKKVWSRHESLT